MARAEALSATPHYIQISRGFLLENPEVAGPYGLGLAPGLLDDNAANGELHPDGVALLGAREIEVNLLAPSGDDEAPPLPVHTTVSEEHLARIVAQLEETSFRNSLLDSDDPVQFDPQRDVYFERARLGLADDIDRRSYAEAGYVYRGMRERYGMVRARESILPFDVVIQGSLTDMSIGAFPRIRMPKKTPDAILYE